VGAASSTFSPIDIRQWAETPPVGGGGGSWQRATMSLGVATMDRPIKPRWSPRVPRHKVRRLYENDARGIVDEVLLDDVGIGLFLRCRSMLAVHGVMMHGRIPCPACGHVFTQDRAGLCDPATPLVCPACGWRLPWGEYHSTFRHQELMGAGGNPFIAEYVEAWPTARTPREKLLLIDRLIHLWHHEEARHERGLGRPTGVNLIEGSRRQVLAFLDALTHGEQATPELREADARWRAGWDEVRAKQAQWRAARRSSPGGPSH